MNKLVIINRGEIAPFFQCSQPDSRRVNYYFILVWMYLFRTPSLMTQEVVFKKMTQLILDAIVGSISMKINQEVIKEPQG